MIKLKDNVRLKREIYDNNLGLIEWLKYYMGESIDYYNIVWIVEEETFKDAFVLRDAKLGLNASSFTLNEMIKVENTMSKLKKRYEKKV